MLNVPLAGPVNVEGLPTDRAAARVSETLATANLVRDGVVTVGLLLPAAQTGVPAGPIAVGDALQVTVFDLVGAGRRLVSLATVGADGQIELPLAGLVKVAGLTEAQADDAVQGPLPRPPHPARGQPSASCASPRRRPPTVASRPPAVPIDPTPSRPAHPAPASGRTFQPTELTRGARVT